MKKNKLVIDGVEAFSHYVGQELGTSEPIEISQGRIDQFCLAVENTEWIHWDLKRCAESGLGTAIMPGFMAPALFSKVFFDLVEITGIPNALFSGVDRMRLLEPVQAGSRILFRAKVEKVEQRSVGVAVYYAVAWNVQGNTQPAGIATFVIRYW